MAEPIEFEVRLKSTGLKRDADNFANRFAESLQSNLGKIGIGRSFAGKTGVGAGDGISQGVAAGLAAGGVVSLLGLIASALKDMPIIVGVMKLFRVLLLLLLMPLIPILKPVLVGLANYVKALSDTMKKHPDLATSASLLGIVGGGVAGGAGGPLGVIAGALIGATAGPMAALGLAYAADSAAIKIKIDLEKTSTERLKDLNTAWKNTIPLVGDLGDKLKEKDGLIPNVKEASTQLAQFSTGLTLIPAILKTIETAALSFVDALSPRSSKSSRSSRGYTPLDILDAQISNVTRGGNSASTTAGGYTPLDILNAQIGNVTGTGGYYNFLTGKVGDAVIQNGKVISTDPSDYLFATKNPGGMGGGMTVNINIDKPTLTGQSDIKALVRAIEMELYKNQRRYSSYGA